MIKNLKNLRQTQPPLGKMTNNNKPVFGVDKNVRESSEEMDFDDWSQSNDLNVNNYNPTNVQKGFYHTKTQNPQYQAHRRVPPFSKEYYDDEFEESDEMEGFQYLANERNINQNSQQQYNIGKATYRRLQHQESSDINFDNDDFDEEISNAQDDDFDDVQLNVRRFKSSAKKNFAKEEKKPEVVNDFTEGSEFNFEDEKSVSNANLKPEPVNRKTNNEKATDKKHPPKFENSNIIQAKDTTKIQGRNINNNKNSINPPKLNIYKKNIPESVEQFEDTFSDDFTQNVGSVNNTQINHEQEKPSVDPKKSEIETFKSDFDDYKDSFNIDISNIDDRSVPQNKKMNVNNVAPQQPTRVASNEISAAIIHDRNVETKYLSNKLEENDAYTKKIKEFLEQKTLENEKLKSKNELLLKEKIKIEDQSYENKRIVETQNLEIEKLVAENDTKQLAIDDLTEKLNKRQEELKAKSKLLQERENMFGNSLNEKKLYTNLNNLTKELEISKIRIEDYQEGIKRYEQRIIELEDELRSSPAAMRTKALMQQKIDKLLKELKDNNITIKPDLLENGEINEDMVYQEMILNGYIKDNKKLIDENKYLKEKLYSNKLNESKTNFDNPINRIKELEESIQRLQQELIKKDENYKKQTQKFDQADEILLEREKEIEKLVKEKKEVELQLKKEKTAFEAQKKDLLQKIKDLNEKNKLTENTKKAKSKGAENRIKDKQDPQVKLQRNIFSQDDRDFKHDIYSMLHNLNDDNNQVKLEIKDLKETWDLKAKLPNEREKIAQNNTKLDRNNNETSINRNEIYTKEDVVLKNQLEQVKEENNNLYEKILNLDQELNEKNRIIKKSEFLQKRWYEERQKLLEIIKNMPKTARDIDFTVLEQKLINLEKEQKLKALELKTALKTFNNEDLSESTDTLHKGQNNWQTEKSKLLAIITQKNNQIGKFKSQMEVLISEFKKLKAAQIN